MPKNSEFYGGLLKSTTCRKFVNVSKGQVKINTAFVKEHLFLNSFKNTKRTGFSEGAAEHFGIEVAVGDGFLDGEGMGLDD